MLHRFTASLSLAATVLLPVRATAQPPAGSAVAPTSVGLASVGAFTLHGGFAGVQRGFRALAAGATLDLGHIASPRLRLLSDVSYLVTFPRSELVVEERRTYRDVFRDLSGELSLALHANAPTSRLSPYIAAGVGVHVLSSSFGSLAIDSRYNTNNFGVVAAAGARLRVGAGGRRALQVEIRDVQARDVRRVSVHLGVTALFNDLASR